MSNSVGNKMPYLRTFRKFPEEQKNLITELTRGWIETANCVNDRIIGTFSTQSTITGKTYFFSGNRYQSLRQLFPFSDTSLTIDHGIKSFVSIIGQSGWFTDGTVWYPFPYVDVTNVTNQVGVSTTSTQILIVKGATAPTISSGIVILEWLQVS